MTTSDDDFVNQFRERLGERPEPPVPPETLKRWHAALDAAARSPARRPAPLNLRFAAVAGMVALSVGIVFVAYRENAMPSVPEPFAAARVERGLQLHLLDLEAQLARAADLPVAERASAIRNLVQQNRLQTAVVERAGGDREARVLRSFTVSLEEMAADTNGKFQAALAQLDFEMKVTQARLASSAPSTSALRSQAL
jgi:hypothetical protein